MLLHLQADASGAQLQQKQALAYCRAYEREAFSVQYNTVMCSAVHHSADSAVHPVGQGQGSAPLPPAPLAQHYCLAGSMNNTHSRMTGVD